MGTQSSGMMFLGVITPRAVVQFSLIHDPLSLSIPTQLLAGFWKTSEDAWRAARQNRGAGFRFRTRRRRSTDPDLRCGVTSDEGREVSSDGRFRKRT